MNQLHIQKHKWETKNFALDELDSTIRVVNSKGEMTALVLGNLTWRTLVDNNHTIIWHISFYSGAQVVSQLFFQSYTAACDWIAENGKDNV